MKNLIYSCLILSVVSCSKQNEKLVIDSSKDSTSIISDEKNYTDSTLVTTSQCYIAGQSGDTVFVSIDDNLGTVSGRMFYKYRMKDRTIGDLVGTSSGDTIKTDYMFESEGRTSTREIWFLKQDGKLLEATGKYDASGEKYADTKNLKFGDSFIYKTADCATVEKALNSVPIKQEAEPPLPAPAAKTTSEKIEQPKQKSEATKEHIKIDKPVEEKKAEQKPATAQKTSEKTKAAAQAKTSTETKKTTAEKKTTTPTKKESQKK